MQTTWSMHQPPFFRAVPKILQGIFVTKGLLRDYFMKEQVKTTDSWLTALHIYIYMIFFWLCRHTASPLITAGTHTVGV